MIGPSSSSGWQIMLHICLYMLGTATKLSHDCAVSSSRVVATHTLERIDLGLAVTEVNTKKYYTTSKLCDYRFPTAQFHVTI